jgi:phosphoglycerate dehydrogenase-like enzyme
MKLVTTQTLPDEIREGLLEMRPHLDIVTVSLDERERFLDEVADAEIIMAGVGGGSTDLVSDMMNAARSLRWLHASTAGVDEIMVPELEQGDILLTCGKGHSVANLLAEHAMALLLSLSRCLVEAARTDHWNRRGFVGRPTEISGKTMGIVGLGGVGQALAKRAAAFDMAVVGIKREPGAWAENPPDGVTAVWGPDDLPRLLSASDVVVLILPNTPETEGLIGAEALRGMKSQALLINVGRGHTVDGEALERALVEGWIAGAGLDVMPTEPWPADSPLWRMDNVLITPHIAGNSPQRADRNMHVFLENFRRYLAGEPLQSLVDREAGY